MGLGNKKGHISGNQVTGRHTTVIDGADEILKKMARNPWFESARPGQIIVDRGGTQSITIKRHIDATHRNTLTLTFRKPGSVQKIDVVVQGLEENIEVIVADIEAIAAKAMRGAEIYDRTGERGS